MDTTSMGYTDQFTGEDWPEDRHDWPLLQPLPRAVRLPRIIYRPDLQNPFRRSGNVVLTLLAWAVWIYLFLPALVVVSQLLGYTQFPFGLRLPLSAGADDTILTLIVYAFLVMAAGGLLLAWATYNLVRFRLCERRRGVATADIHDPEGNAYVSKRALRRLRACQIAWLDHDERGGIVDVRPRLTLAAATADTSRPHGAVGYLPWLDLR